MVFSVSELFHNYLLEMLIFPGILKPDGIQDQWFQNANSF